ncbi:beta-aspartyl-peptidase (threonine type) [Sphingopyxis sp. OAS728]|uniref:isoaspartyl peptidase/L-asparaginase family protein n=1 Tax=Sphingopyxis sp. OAS728 TaxID=2663823 RepID=UPI0017890402|nr:isoaspartyl peptidase/L-asparaginase family protein [Sphingopyxis sp. OAS728]MBE1526907.1 beta-aspartyl-peptidase (threonine type) [Sphingopyxis sp. OAS728]
MADRPWSIVVHGGARSIPPEKAEAHRAGCRRAADAGAAVLQAGATAVVAARIAVCVLEDDPTFNAGRGSVPNLAGEIEMDAAIMDGASLGVGAVAAVRHIYNPIEAAAAMLAAEPILLVGPGAEDFARSRGVPCAGLPLAPAPSPGGGHDTVGCVAFDQAGHVAAATSTGGLAGTLPGRVGDAPLPGCGFYADDAVGGVSLSGDGEAIARALLGARVMRAMEEGHAGTAVNAIRAPMQRLAAEAGVIAIDAAGRIGMAHNSDHFAVAFADRNRAAAIAVLHETEWRKEMNHD